MAPDVFIFTDLDAVAADAGDSLDRSHQSQLFDRLSWFRLVAQHSARPSEPLVIRSRDDQGAAWLFLARCGTHATALANWYSLETGVVTSGTAHPALIEATARTLRQRIGLSAIDLAPLHADRLDLLVAAFKAAGWSPHITEATVNWTISVKGSDWAAYLAARPSRLRNTIDRKMRANDFRIEIFNIFSDDGWNIYEHIYNQSWKPMEGSPALLRSLARQEADADTLRLGLAFAGEIPIAAQFWLVENGRATIHKLAHVQSWHAQSPGTVLTAAMFRHVIEQDHVETIDFGTGNDPYKADWMDHRETLYRLQLFNPHSPAGLAGIGREVLSKIRSTISRTRKIQ